MAGPVTRVGDIGIGTCDHPDHDSPEDYTTTFVTGANGLGAHHTICGIGSVGTSTCGHNTVAMTGAGGPSGAVHRVGDVGQNAGPYIVMSGAPDFIVGDSSGGGGVSVPGFQPWVSEIEAAMTAGEDSTGPITEEQKVMMRKAGIDPDQKNPDPPPPAPAEPIPPATTAPVAPGCSAFAQQTSFPPSFPLSANFKLAHLSTATLLEKGEVKAQSGLTIQEIVCNLKGVAENILEPLTAKFGRPNINCGFRPANAGYGSPTSAHKLGHAVDLQWPGLSDQQYYERACWIRDNMNWTQIILEYGGNRPWIHVSYYAPTALRKNTKSRITVPSGYVQGIVLATNVPKVGAKRV